MELKTGLVLTGGGARAAYQAGAMKAIAEILHAKNGQPSPFQIMTGISAGAINASYYAGRAESFISSTLECYDIWNTLTPQKILQTDLFSLAKISMGWLRDLSLGAHFGTRVSYLLNTIPLRKLLTDIISFNAIQQNIRHGYIHGLGLSCTNYKTGTAVTFFDGHSSIQPWARSSRVGKRTELTHAHVLASASIPVLFEPVRMEGSFYGDGGIRLRTPISPAIHLGSDRIVAIGIRYYREEDMTIEMNQLVKMEDITIADISGVMLNSAFMDALEGDVERMLRINETLKLLSEEDRLKHPQKLKIIPLLVIRPSQDLGNLAADQFQYFPKIMRHFLKGLGASDERGSDLLSYLAFDKNYTGPLLELGYSDAMKMRGEIEEFFG